MELQKFIGAQRGGVVEMFKIVSIIRPSLLKISETIKKEPDYIFPINKLAAYEITGH